MTRSDGSKKQERSHKKDIQEIQLYPEQQENGQVLKSMKFKFPVFFNGQTIAEISWDKGIPQQNDTEVTKIFGFVPKKNSVKAVIFWRF